MNVSTDTKRLKARMNDIQVRLLFDKVIKPYKQHNDPNYYYSIVDQHHGVFLGHLPKAAYMNYTTTLHFQGYSDDSPLLKAIFAIVPLEQWFASEIHVAVDFHKPYEQFHAVRPAKRADPEWYPKGLYLGGASSATRLLIYDKQDEMWRRKHIGTDDWTRAELRFSFTPMKRIRDIAVEDFSAADQYMLFTDIASLPDNIKAIVTNLNQNRIQWEDVHWKMKKKIRECAATSEQAINLHGPILSTLRNQDIGSFIYKPTKQLGVLSSLEE